MPTGYLTLFDVRGVPLRMHWTLPMVAVAAGWLVSGSLLPVAEALQWLGILAAHLGGHALVAQAHGGTVVELRLHSLGGRALTTGHLSLRARTSLAWGGMLGQMGLMALLFLVVLLDRGALERPAVLHPLQLNALLMAVNLLPFGELDGRLGWPRLARSFQGPPVDPRDPLGEPGLERRIERAAERLRFSRPPAPEAPPAVLEEVPPEEMPPEIVKAADSLMEQLRAERRPRPRADEVPPKD
jgi:hypothetical protein